MERTGFDAWITFRVLNMGIEGFVVETYRGTSALESQDSGTLSIYFPRYTVARTWLRSQTNPGKRAICEKCLWSSSCRGGCCPAGIRGASRCPCRRRRPDMPSPSGHPFQNGLFLCKHRQIHRIVLRHLRFLDAHCLIATHACGIIPWTCRANPLCFPSILAG